MFALMVMWLFISWLFSYSLFELRIKRLFHWTALLLITYY